MNQPQQYDVAIVGAGLAGLTAALFALRARRSVIVLEKAPAPGGRATTRSVDDFQFNQGPHALYRGGDAAAILRELGITYSGAQASYEGSWVLRGEEKFPLPGTPEVILSSPLFSKSAAEEMLGVFGSLTGEMPAEWNHLTLTDWLQRNLRHDEVRSVIESIVRLSTYCADSGRQSAGAALVQTAMGRGGVDYLDGGWQQLVDRLREEAGAAGARLETRWAVESVESDGTRVRIRGAAGRELIARTAIVTAPPAATARLVNGGAVESLQRWAREAVPIYAACLDLGLRRLPRQEHQFAIGLDRPTYYSVHTRSAKLAPEGGALVHVAKYLTAGAAEDPAEVETELEREMDRLQPGWRDELVTRRYLARIVVAHAVVSAERGGYPGRPGPAVPGLGNVFVAGDWVGGAGMLADAAMASAREAARLATSPLAPVPPRSETSEPELVSA